ncbi:GH25 family lysozyme [Sphingomonas sp. LB-2]|uniref:GH25 family lysozyme n=1 Tax=Sphingomonas caeni TaxID=2984949 RepID=UPI00222F94CB|nr:GH25 family lysozyme [Sphingomonas caeni]MCW3845900.1 GH25 family lysozyme [Sphingomonas caeni]
MSHHQGVIDWTAVARQRQVDFAYIKASEGGTSRDPMFEVNWKGAGAAGIARGAYHYFSLCTPGDVQAANFIAAVPGDGNMLAPAVDLEFGGNCADRPEPEALFVELMIFIRAVETRYRQPVVLYLTREFDSGYGVSARIHRRLWLRSIFREPKWGARPWAIWQASSFRSVPGIEGRVDWNVWRP